MEVVLYPSKDFGKQVERSAKAREPFVIRVPAGEKRKEILVEYLPAALGHAPDPKKTIFRLFTDTLLTMGFYTGVAKVMADGSGYDVGYVDDGDLLITCTPDPKSGRLRDE